ncbi:cytochrome P450 [Geodermatophilus sp. DSM 44513]|uniref:cytochrome P450 n=1 Tax=Geodermatophilus sp. DSM 44513 TaxID=1528104 RepID=UPI00127E89B4|nr:cytochrome P450 [Geodermatophilus sp. DSM 44513]WNV73576.1 cytochrome P450 [Geodermatophilus sp. DSM 44513]
MPVQAGRAGAVEQQGRSAVRWAATHAVVRVGIRVRARAGNPDAQVLADPAVRADPYPHYERLRTPAPLTDGALARVSVHHDVCTDVLRSEDFGQIGGARADRLPPVLRLALRLAGPRPGVSPVDPPSMVAVDPPDHTRYRRLVSRAFSARAVAALRARTREVADELLDGLERQAAANGGRVDLAAGYADLLPVTVVSEVLGVPVEMREQFLEWGDRAAPVLDLGLDWATHRDVEATLVELDAWWRGHLRRLRRDPGADLLSRLVTEVDDDGAGLTEPELRATAALVLGAGFETTVNLIGNGAALLFAHPDQRRLLAADPSLWPNAVDEVLRVDPPVQRTGRRARRDTTVHGVPVAEGEWLVLLLAAANRDPRVFPDPHVFDVTRRNAREHLAFASGIHFCLGAALARMEGEVALQALFERFPDLAPAGPGQRRGTVILRGHRSLPVVLRPASRHTRPVPGREPAGTGPA